MRERVNILSSTSAGLAAADVLVSNFVSYVLIFFSAKFNHILKLNYDNSEVDLFKDILDNTLNFKK